MRLAMRHLFLNPWIIFEGIQTSCTFVLQGNSMRLWSCDLPLFPKGNVSQCMTSCLQSDLSTYWAHGANPNQFLSKCMEVFKGFSWTCTIHSSQLVDPNSWTWEVSFCTSLTKPARVLWGRNTLWHPSKPFFNSPMLKKSFETTFGAGKLPGVVPSTLLKVTQVWSLTRLVKLSNAKAMVKSYDALLNHVDTKSIDSCIIVTTMVWKCVKILGDFQSGSGWHAKAMSSQQGVQKKILANEVGTFVATHSGFTWRSTFVPTRSKIFVKRGLIIVCPV